MHARSSLSSGFTLIEVLIALLLLTTVVSGLVPMMTISARAVQDARTETMAAFLAAQKLEQLRALRFGVDDGGAAVTDYVTDLSAAAPAIGGIGLGTSPADALEKPAAGFSDYLDRWGRWVAGGGPRPASASYERRWAVRPLTGAPVEGLVLEVIVEPIPRGAPVHLAALVVRKGAP